LVIDNTSADEVQWVVPTRRRVLVAVASAAACLALSIAATATMLYLLVLSDRVAESWSGPEWQGLWQHAKLAPTVVYVGSVSAFSAANAALAARLTDWEAHRTQSAHVNARVAKLVSLEFCNVFVALFYVAFVKLRVDQLYDNLFALLGVYQVIG
jgi:anoctamin-10